MDDVSLSDAGEACPTVFIVDDDAAIRDALEVLLQSTGIGTRAFASPDDFLSWYDGSQCGCLILDVRMPGMNGLELQSKLASNGSPIPVIFLTGYGEVPTTAKAFKQGAVDFLEKPFHEHALLEAIRRALAADRAERERYGRIRSFEAFLNSLTRREREVLDRVVSGMTTKSIAGELGVSNQAIDAHRQRLFRKAGVDNVAALVQLVVTARLLVQGKDSAGSDQGLPQSLD